MDEQSYFLQFSGDDTDTLGSVEANLLVAIAEQTFPRGLQLHSPTERETAHDLSAGGYITLDEQHGVYRAKVTQRGLSALGKLKNGVHINPAWQGNVADVD